MIGKTIAKKRKLNPFAFPPETNALFTLLVVAALLWMLELGQVLGQASGLVNSPDALATANAIELGTYEWKQALLQSVQMLFLPFILILATFFLATIIYLIHPFRIRFNRKLRQITREDDPEFVGAMQKLISLSGIAPSPGIEVEPASRSTDGQAFGLWNHYALRLSGRLRLLFRQDPEGFRAIILHELAHIANADIFRTYFSQAIWVAVVGLTVIPFTVLIFVKIWTGLSPNDAPIVLLALVKTSVTLLIINAIRGNLLQTREYYADWRASLWGAGESLVKILRRNDTLTNKTMHWTRLWKFHPAPRQRLAGLQDPGGLFLIKLALSFFVGVLPGLMLGGLSSESQILIDILTGMGTGMEQVFGNNLFNNGWDAVLIAFMAFVLLAIPGLIIIHLITQSLGLAVQRETVANMVTGREGWSTYLNLWKPAVLVVIGFQIGNLLTISSILELFPTLFQSLQGFLYLGLMIFLNVILVFLTWLGLVYIRYFSRQVLGSHVGISLPKGKMLLLALALSGLLLMFYIPMMFGQMIIEGAASVGDTSMLIWLLGVILAEVIAIFLYGFVFVATWLSSKVLRLVWKPQCPTCGQAVYQQYAVAQLCKHCGSELAPWLYSA